jgi:hypothetical protein
VLVARAGGYLRNPVRRDGVTCAVCTGSVNGGARCYQCRQHRGRPGLADATAFLTYAIAGRPSGQVMRGYKELPRPVDDHRAVVGLLAAVGLARHGACAGALARVPVTHWAAVPSLPARPGEHPLRPLVARLAPGHEVQLIPAADPQHPRGARPGNFTVPGLLPTDAHVLVIDDTWASGGHAQSAALALHAAGAGHVSVLVLARWLDRHYSTTAQLLRAIDDRDYDPAICPWTAGGCPLPARASSLTIRG